MKSFVIFSSMILLVSTANAGRWIAPDIKFEQTKPQSQPLLADGELSITIRTYCFNPQSRGLYWLFSKSFACESISIQDAYFSAQFKNSSTIGGDDTYYLRSEEGVHLIGNPYKISAFDLVKLGQLGARVDEHHPLYLIVNKSMEIVRVVSTVD